MVNYLIKRTARVFVTIWAVATLTFGLIRLLPGGPFTQLRIQLLRQGLPPEQVEERIQNLQNIRPDAPLWQQYLDYMVALLQGNLGRSIRLDEPVIEVVANAAPWTIFLVTVSTILVFAIGIVTGALQAYWEGSWFDKFFTGLSMGALSVPFYVLAVILLFIFAYNLDWFPTSGRYDHSIENVWSIAYLLSVIRHAILPIAAYSLGAAGGQALAMRGNSIQVLGEDYVEVARLRGLADSRIATRYVGRNAILPMYTGFLLLLGFRLGGTIILEQIFTYQGLGLRLFQALNQNDYPLMMGTFLVITVVLVLGVYVADLTYSRIDPRISRGDEGEAY